MTILQKHPDPEFSTVKYPNPEEGKSALVRPVFSLRVGLSGQ